MPPPRRIYVFYRSDGKCIHDTPWPTPNAPHPPPPHPPLPSETLFPLIQVFIQFSREVQGNFVKRLVFRPPPPPFPPLKRFHSTIPPSPTSNPLVFHVAHDELFLVAVTEVLLAEPHHALQMTHEEGEQPPGITMAEFCESLLDFLNQEQSSFLATLASRDYKGHGLGRQGHLGQRSSENQEASRSTIPSTFRSIRTKSSASSHTLSFHSDSSNSAAEDRLLAPTTIKPVVDISDARLSEFISKTQNLLRI